MIPAPVDFMIKHSIPSWKIPSHMEGNRMIEIDMRLVRFIKPDGQTSEDVYHKETTERMINMGAPHVVGS